MACHSSIPLAGTKCFESLLSRYGMIRIWFMYIMFSPDARVYKVAGICIRRDMYFGMIVLGSIVKLGDRTNQASSSITSFVIVVAVTDVVGIARTTTFYLLPLSNTVFKTQNFLTLFTANFAISISLKKSISFLNNRKKSVRWNRKTFNKIQIFA